MIDKEKAVRTFLCQVNRLSMLPLIADDETGKLFGEEVTAALNVLSRYDDEKRLCQNCLQRCCLVAKCELYSTQFGRCPIYEFRPVVCRFHFCRSFQVDYAALVTELSDTFFDCLLTAEKEGYPAVKLFDSPPLARSLPSTISKITSWVQQVETGTLEAEEGMRLVHLAVEKHFASGRNQPS